MATFAAEDSVQVLLYVVMNDEFRGYKPDLVLQVLSNIENTILTCPLCQGITREAVVKEGQTMCSMCGVTKIVPKKHQSSVTDKVDFNYPPYPNSVTDYPDTSILSAPMVSVAENKDVRELVTKLEVICPLSKRGCEWKGEVGDLEEHVHACEHLMIACSQSCGSVFVQREMSDHLVNMCKMRIIHCDYCQGRFLAKEMETHVLVDCLSVPILCPQKCGQESVRSRMQEHLDEVCELSRVVCPFKSCEEVSLVRKELKEHHEESIIYHQQCLCQQVEGQIQQCEKQNGEIELLKSRISQQDSKLDHRNEQVAQLQNLMWSQSNEHRREIEMSNSTISESESKQTKLKNKIDQQNARINRQDKENLRLENLIEKIHEKMTIMETYVKNIPSLIPEMLLCRSIINGQFLNAYDLRPIDKFEWEITGISKKYGTHDYLEGPTFSLFSNYTVQCRCLFGAGFLNIYLKSNWVLGYDEIVLQHLSICYYCIQIVNRMDETRSIVDMGTKNCVLKDKYLFFARLSPLVFPEFVQKNSIKIRIQLIRNVDSLKL